MGIFGRTRANTTNGGISQPILTFSDAAPRDDLQSLERLDSTYPRPRTAKPEKPTGTTSIGRGLRRRSQKNGIQAFDFTVTEPPEGPLAVDEPASFNEGMDSHAIGIALGSPSMVPPPVYHPIEWTSPSSQQQSAWTTTTVSSAGSLRRKPSKWKKFGGMLKGSRQNEGKRTHEGFYQLGMDKSHDDTMPVTQNAEYKQPFVSVSPRFGSDERWEDQNQKTPADSLLTVNIPTVQMERYSVMFRSVLGEKPTSNLLARRSKALDHLLVDGMESGLHEPRIPQRRATSPSANQSPAFTLLPEASQNKIRINGQDKSASTTNDFALRSPIRSNTFPRVRKNINNDNRLAVPDLTPALSTGTSSGFSSAGYSSAEPSPIHFNVPTTARDYINPKSEPVWEMITTKRASGSPKDVGSSTDVEASQKATSTPTMTTPLIPEDHVTQSAKPATKPSIMVLPPRTVSLPAYADRARLKVKNKTHEDNDPLLSINETHQSPSDDMEQRPPQLVRSQTMPLPLNVSKKSSPTLTNQATTTGGTPLLHSSSSVDSLPPGTETPFLSTHSQSSSQAPSPQIPQTIEISIARSVSVSRRIIPKKTLVPLGANPHVFFHNENERYGELQKRVPVVIDVSSPKTAADDSNGSGPPSGGEGSGLAVRGSAGHRYQKSQDIVIESA